MLLRPRLARPDSPTDAPLLTEMGINYANATSCTSRFDICNSVLYRPRESSSYVRGFGTCTGHDHALNGGACAQCGRHAERSLETGGRLILEEKTCTQT